MCAKKKMRPILILLFCFVAYSTASIFSIDLCELKVMWRASWSAEEAIKVKKFSSPVKYVIIHETGTSSCSLKFPCIKTIRKETYYSHKFSNNVKFDDLVYNFVIAGDGQVYEGFGWNNVGSHTNGYNNQSIGIALDGNFENELPPAKQLQAIRFLLRCGEKWHTLDSNYTVIGAKDVSLVKNPGSKLYQEIENWSKT